MENAETLDHNDEYLPVGTDLLNGTYRITDHLGAGGFGLTYLADDQIGRKVVIKECFPASICIRDRLRVRAQTPAQQENFEKLIKNFVNEARQLAKLKHPNVVPVLHFFEEHDTAYMSLEYIRGQDLATRIHEGSEMSPERIIEIATGLLRALDYIHARGLLHRDIAPDNVIINETDQPVLIDFGASRNEMAQAVTRLLSQQLRAVKDGYSPQEFYMPGRQHTPASDLYSLAATIYTLITGYIPEDAYSRLVELSKKEPDPLRPLLGHVDGFPESFLEAIDKALSLLPKDRPQSAEDLRLLMAPNTANVTPLARKMADGQEAPDGRIAPKRPTRDPSPHVSRPPSVDPNAPRKQVSQPPFDPDRPTRIVKPRILTRSSEQPPAGTVPVQPPAVKQPAPPPKTPKTPKPATEPQTYRSKQAPPTPKPLSTPPEGSEPGASAYHPDDETPVYAPTSTLDKLLRGVALAVIASGAFIGLGGQTLVFDRAADRVQAGVASIGAGSIVISSTPSASFDLAALPTPAPDDPAADTEQGSLLGEPILEPVGVQTGWGADGWTVTLDLPLIFDGRHVVFAPSGSSPYPAGTILTRVAGVEAGTDPAGVATLAAEYFAAADPASPRLPVAVRNPAFDSRGAAELRVDVSRVVDFGAFTLSQRPEGEAWTARVAIAKPGSGLRDGDVIRAEQDSGVTISRIADLEAVFAAHRANGVAETTLIVERSGAQQEVRLQMSDILSGDGAI